jgi:hypothetical protein
VRPDRRCDLFLFCSQGRHRSGRCFCVEHSVSCLPASDR